VEDHDASTFSLITIKTSALPSQGHHLLRCVPAREGRAFAAPCDVHCVIAFFLSSLSFSRLNYKLYKRDKRDQLSHG